MATEIILSKQTMSSLEIAELAVRRHKDVLEAWSQHGRKSLGGNFGSVNIKILPGDYSHVMS